VKDDRVRKAFITALREAFEESGLTQAEFARRIKLQPQYLHLLLSGKRLGGQKALKTADRINFDTDLLTRKSLPDELTLGFEPKDDSKLQDDSDTNTPSVNVINIPNIKKHMPKLVEYIEYIEQTLSFNHFNHIKNIMKSMAEDDEMFNAIDK